MNLHIKNDLGKISISNTVFATIIRDSFFLMDSRGRIWPSTKKGRIIGNDGKFNINEFANQISVTFDDNNNVYLEFSVIIKFGTSIKKVTDVISNYIAEAIEEIHGEKPMQIAIKITGVKSKQIARRNTEVIKVYDINR